jgi:hypothetical protein
VKLIHMLIIGTCPYLVGCTPAEVVVAEEIVEEVIEYERRGVRPTEPYPPRTNWESDCKKHDDTTRVSNKRHYPRRGERNPGWGA